MGKIETNKPKIDEKTGAVLAQLVITHEELQRAVEAWNNNKNRATESARRVVNFASALLYEIAKYEKGKNNTMYIVPPVIRARRDSKHEIPESVIEELKKAGRVMNFYAREVEHSTRLRDDNSSTREHFAITEGYSNDIGENQAHINQYTITMNGPQTLISILLQIGAYSYCLNNNRLQYFVLGKGCARAKALSVFAEKGINATVEQYNDGGQFNNILMLEADYDKIIASASQLPQSDVSGQEIQDIDGEDLVSEFLRAATAITSTTADEEVLNSWGGVVEGNVYSRCTKVKTLMGATYKYDVQHGILKITKSYSMSKPNVFSEEIREEFAAYGIKSSYVMNERACAHWSMVLTIEADLNKIKELAGPAMTMKQS